MQLDALAIMKVRKIKDKYKEERVREKLFDNTFRELGLFEYEEEYGPAVYNEILTFIQLSMSHCRSYPESRCLDNVNSIVGVITFALDAHRIPTDSVMELSLEIIFGLAYDSILYQKNKQAVISSTIVLVQLGRIARKFQKKPIIKEISVRWQDLRDTTDRSQIAEKEKLKKYLTLKERLTEVHNLSADAHKIEEKMHNVYGTYC